LGTTKLTIVVAAAMLGVARTSEGSHRHYRHAIKPGTTTVAGNLRKEVKTGTLANILRQAGLKGPR